MLILLFDVDTHSSCDRMNRETIENVRGARARYVWYRVCVRVCARMHERSHAHARIEREASSY